MSNLFKITVVALVFLAGGAQAQAQALNKVDISKYPVVTDYYLLSCRAAQTSIDVGKQIAKMQGVPNTKGPEDLLRLQSCIEKYKSQSRSEFDGYMQSIKTEKSKDAFKSYYIAFVVALEAIPSGFNESDEAYRLRHQSLKGKMTEAWARFELEM